MGSVETDCASCVQPPFAGRQTGGMRINGAAFFKQSFELKIKGDLIPEAAAEEIIGELQALFARHNAGATLSAKAVFNPNPAIELKLLP